MSIVPYLDLVKYMRDLVPLVLGMLIKNPFNISGINIPVVDFAEGISALHRIGNFFGTSPYYMNRAYKTTSVRDRITCIANMIISCQHINMNLRSSFFPIIGETITACID